jgi:HlyD family secretion protein
VSAAAETAKASEAVAEFARSEVDRLTKLKETGAANEVEVRSAETNARKADAEHKSDLLQLAALKTLAAVSYIGPKFITDYIDRKTFDLESNRQQLEEAKARLEIEKRNLSRAEMKSPIDGVVLKRHQSQRQYLSAGTPLLTLGRLEDLEVAAEVLSERATRITPGNPVDIYGEAIETGPVPGKVLRVFPAGFKKISSLGVEQQRVKVTVKPEHRPERLGTEFRVLVRIYYAEAANALTLPRTALFRSGEGDWQVLIVRDGQAQLQTVQLGLMNDVEAQITSGLSRDDRIIAKPSSEITPGMRIAPLNP